jgi:hypothetical protein
MGVRKVNREEAEKHFGPAMVRLARMLYETLERLDPGSCGGSDWNELPEFDVSYYASAMREVVGQPHLVIGAVADDDVIRWKAELSKKMHHG